MDTRRAGQMTFSNRNEALGTERTLIMKTFKNIKSLSLLIGLWIAAVGTASAVNPDTIVISVTPSVTYSVSITSPMVQGYQFGTVALGATTISTVAITVANNGNVAQYFAMAISNSSPGTWTPQAAAAADQYNMRAYFNTTQPASATFVDNLTTSVPGAGATLYGQASTKTNAAASKNLWLRLAMPTSITGAASAQTMTLTINGQAL